MKYFSAHPTFNSFLHVFAGIGFGILIARPIIGVHPLRWTLVFLGLSLLGHLYALMVG